MYLNTCNKYLVFNYIKENIIKKEHRAEVNELKDLLFNDNTITVDYYKKNYSENNKTNTLKNEKDKLSKTTFSKEQKNFFNSNDGIINNRIINLEIKEIIQNADENLRKKINIKKIKEKCKENYKTIIKLRENIKYKNDMLNQKFKKLKSK